MIHDEPRGATPLDPDELEGLKHKHITTRDELNELEQANIQVCLQWISRSRQRDILSDEFLRILHKRMFGDVWDWAGTYRQTEKNIGVDPFHISTKLRMLVDDARYWVEQNTYPPLEAAARFHHRMVQIHPFPNGNGRHARIATDLYLERHFGHAPIEWAHGFNIQTNNKRRNAYITALRAADGGDYEPLLEFVGAR
ncbi:MAG: mobile mystery protein B [Hyphomicrobiales bacterium]|nr:mobile mystery protein B [Hyphomicrobiales bacterium]MCY4048556.1 mobile mystery protein B [Hyphomicrobiales bacterium]